MEENTSAKEQKSVEAPVPHKHHRDWLGTAIGLTDQSYGKGAFFYSKTKLQPSTNKTDYYTQAGFLFTTSRVAVTSQAYSVTV
jgi:hypothetical protein